MLVYRSLDAWCAAQPATPTVISVGNFDGVHRAHQQLLRAVSAEAAAQGVLSLAATFEPHPARLLRPDAAPGVLTPLPQKLELLEACGLAAVLVLEFNPSLAQIPPRAFAAEVLTGALHARSVHEGANFRFGQGHAGTLAMLRSYGEELGFAVHDHAQVEVGGEVVSSSRIRALLAEGEVERAAGLLGRAYAMQGEVIAGRGVGREQTVPTLNLGGCAALAPDHGVYITEAQWRGRCWPAVSNLGVRPTFNDGGGPSLETHLLEPTAAAPASPGDPLAITFLRRLRAERRFDSPAALRAQIGEDVAQARQYFTSR